MKNYFLFFSLLFLFWACDNNDDNELRPLATLVDNETVFISVSSSEDVINFRIEALTDTSNQIFGTFPSVDFCTVIFDINANAEIDNNLDFGYSSQTSSYEICDFYLIDSTTISSCGALTNEASFEAEFASSERNSLEHVIWNLQIPRAAFNNQQSINFRIKTYEAGLYRNYPEGRIPENSGSFSFEDTYRIEL